MSSFWGFVDRDSAVGGFWRDFRVYGCFEHENLDRQRPYHTAMVITVPRFLSRFAAWRLRAADDATSDEADGASPERARPEGSPSCGSGRAERSGAPYRGSPGGSSARSKR